MCFTGNVEEYCNHYVNIHSCMVNSFSSLILNMLRADEPYTVGQIILVLFFLSVSAGRIEGPNGPHLAHRP